MAALNPVIARIKYVTGQGPYQATPSTVTGNDEVVYSYRMPIARKNENGAWTVVNYEDGPSITTKRHIRAAWHALGLA